MNKDAVMVSMLAEQLLDYPLSPRRAEELAAEVKQLADAVRDVAQILQFDDAPSAFTILVESAPD